MTLEFNLSNYLVGISNNVFQLQKALNREDYKEAGELFTAIDKKIESLQESNHKVPDELLIRYNNLKKIAYSFKIVC